MNPFVNKPGRRPPPSSRASSTRRTPAPTAATPRQNTLDPATKRRLIEIGGLASVLVFAIGLTGFTIFFSLDRDGPGANGPGREIHQTEQQANAARLRAGGELVQAVTGDDGTLEGGEGINFNPIYATGEAAQTVVDLIFPRLLGQDPTSGLVVPTELAEGWEVSEDGRTYTFFLRDSVHWSDGAPVTAEDVRYTYTALAQTDLQSPFRSHAELIESIHAPDAHTLVVTLRAPNCSALHSLRRPLLPSGRYAPDFSDVSSHPLNLTPEVGAGPFGFESYTPGERIVLARNPDYWKGPPRLERYVLRIAPDVSEQASLLETGEVHLARLPTAPHNGALSFAPDAPVRILTQPQPGYTFLAANLGAPNQPLPGRTEAGEPQAQTPHPILGELEVRRALALAIDGSALAAALGEDEDTTYPGGYLLGGYLLPSIPWANPSPPAPLPHDLQQARDLLDAAGWTPDASGMRSREGRPLALRLMTNQDNPLRLAMARIIERSLTEIGVQVRLEVLPFEAMSAELLEQRFDLSVAGWENLAADPGLHPFWHSRDDVPGQGFNFTSFHDREVDAWLDQAQTLPGCAPDVRGELYARAQTQIQSRLPYLAIVGAWGGWAAAEGIQNFAPGPWQLHYNVQDWGWAE